MKPTFEQFKAAVDKKFVFNTGNHEDLYRDFMKSDEYLDEVKNRYRDFENPDNERYFDSIVSSCAWCLWHLA